MSQTSTRFLLMTPHLLAVDGLFVRMVGDDLRAAVRAGHAQVLETLELTALALPVADGEVDEVERAGLPEIAEGEDAGEDRLQAGVFTLLGEEVHLQEPLVRLALHVDQVRQRHIAADLGEVVTNRLLFRHGIRSFDGLLALWCSCDRRGHVAGDATWLATQEVGNHVERAAPPSLRLREVIRVSVHCNKGNSGRRTFRPARIIVQRVSCRRLLDRDLGAGLFEDLLDLVGLFLRDAFLDRSAERPRRGPSLPSGRAGDFADCLDDVDLLVAGLAEDDGELGLLFDRGRGRGRAGSRRGSGSGSRAETPKRSSRALTRLERSRTDIVSICFTKSSVEIAISASKSVVRSISCEFHRRARAF